MLGSRNAERAAASALFIQNSDQKNWPGIPTTKTSYWLNCKSQGEQCFTFRIPE